MGSQLANDYSLNDLDRLLEADRRLETVSPDRDDTMRVTQGQLDAVAMRCSAELATSLRRTGTNTVARLKDNILTVRVEHSLAAAEQHLMRRSKGREFFQHYIEELAEQMHPDLKRNIEQILPYSVTDVRVSVDCDQDCIVFRFGLDPRPSWAASTVGADPTLPV